MHGIHAPPSYGVQCAELVTAPSPYMGGSLLLHAAEPARAIIVQFAPTTAAPFGSAGTSQPHGGDVLEPHSERHFEAAEISLWIAADVANLRVERIDQIAELTGHRRKLP